MFTRKSVAILTWVLIGSAYLWLLSYAKFPTLSIDSFIHFTVMLIGAGIIYDVAAKMYAIPSFRDNWGSLLMEMSGVIIGFIVVIGGITIDIKGALPSHCGGVIAILGIAFAIWQTTRAEEVFKKLQGMFG